MPAAEPDKMASTSEQTKQTFNNLYLKLMPFYQVQLLQEPDKMASTPDVKPPITCFGKSVIAGGKNKIAANSKKKTGHILASCSCVATTNAEG